MTPMTIATIARYAIAATAIFHGTWVLKPGIRRKNPALGTGSAPTVAATTHEVPFQRQVPSEERLETH